jgi:hypothetical protein
MTEAPIEDVVEQSLVADGSEDAGTDLGDLPLESDPADVAEQAAEVGLDDDEQR